MKITALACSLALAACQTTPTGAACDINYVGPAPQHYVEAGRALDPWIVTLPSDQVLEQCDGLTPVGCIDGNADLSWRFIIVTDEPERWNLTRQQTIDHEMAHWGEYTLNGDANAGHCGWKEN